MMDERKKEMVVDTVCLLRFLHRHGLMAHAKTGETIEINSDGKLLLALAIQELMFKWKITDGDLIVAMQSGRNTYQ